MEDLTRPSESAAMVAVTLDSTPIVTYNINKLFSMSASVIFELQKSEPNRLKRLSRAQNCTPRGDVQLRAAAEVAVLL